MKRLFVVKDKAGKIMSFPKERQSMFISADLKYTELKKYAKRLRDELGGVAAGFRVSRGPDHIGKHSGYRIPRMRRQPK